MRIVVKKTNEVEKAWEIAEATRDYFETGMEEIREDLKSLKDLYGIYVGSEMVGFVLYEIEDRVAEIKWLAVLPRFRGRGLGSKLVRESMDELGVDVVKVKTLAETNPDPGYARTRRFYEKLGFVTVDIIDPYPGWGEGNPCQIMIKCLSNKL